MNKLEMKQIATSRYDCIVVGGGIAGLTTAIKLSKAGLKVLILEKSSFPGGKAISICCQATDHCLKCGACYVYPLIRELKQQPLIELQTLATVKKYAPVGDGYHITINRNKLWVNPNLCIGCGACSQKCPLKENPAIGPATAGPLFKGYTIDPHLCLNNGAEHCNRCANICPFGAISITEQDVTEVAHTKSIVFATGFEPFDLHSKKQYRFGRVKNVVAAADLSKQLISNKLTRPSDNTVPEKLAFLQCVGSRSVRDHINCSRVCCGYTTRLINMLRHYYPEVEITRFYLDLQPLGRDGERVYQAASGPGIINIRSLPAEIEELPDGDVRLSYEDRHEGEMKSDIFSLVVLCSGIPVADISENIIEESRLTVNKDGFVSTNELPPGIFATGTAIRPMDIEESICHASSTAGRAIAWAKGKKPSLPSP